MFQIFQSSIVGLHMKFIFLSVLLTNMVSYNFYDVWRQHDFLLFRSISLFIHLLLKLYLLHKLPIVNNTAMNIKNMYLFDVFILCFVIWWFSIIWIQLGKMHGSCGNLEDIFDDTTYIFTTTIIINNNSKLSLFLMVSSSIFDIFQFFDNTHICKYSKISNWGSDFNYQNDK